MASRWPCFQVPRWTGQAFLTYGVTPPGAHLRVQGRPWKEVPPPQDWFGSYLPWTSTTQVQADSI